MAHYVQLDTADWRNGTAGLSDGAKVVYLAIIQEIMFAEGPITFNERILAGLTERSTRALRSAIDELVSSGKIAIEDGKLRNERCERELLALKEGRAKHGNRPNSKKVRTPLADGSSTIHAPFEPENSANSPRTVDEPQKNINDFNTGDGVNSPLEEKRREEKRVSSLRSDSAGAPEAPKPAKPKSSAKGSRLPADWMPNDAGRKFAAEKLGNSGARAELEKFRDYWCAVPGQKGVKLDWEATWRNRVRDIAERRQRGAAAPSYGAPRGPQRSAYQELLASKSARYFGGPEPPGEPLDVTPPPFVIEH